MALHPLTRQALLDAKVSEQHVRKIEEDEWRWDIERAPAVSASADLETARKNAQQAARREDFVFKLWSPEPAEHLPDGMATIELSIANAAGAHIVATRRYEDAMADRAGAQSPLFPPGTLTDWTSVENAIAWDALAFEFRRAAAAVAASHSPDRPAPALVLLQLCRHHFELALKAIIIAAENPEPSRLPHGHPLECLWKRAEPLITNHYGGLDDGDLRKARAIIMELEKFDPTAMETRYPEAKDGTPFSRPRTTRNFSVRRFMDVFEWTADFLSMASLWIELARRNREVSEPRQSP